MENIPHKMKKEKKYTIDSVDREILYYLQRDASMTIKQIAEKIHLSPTPCWKRIQRMEDSGIIRARVALLDPAKVNVEITVFISIMTDQHNTAWSEKFAHEMSSIPEIMEIYRMSGEVDYLLRVVVSDIPAFDELYKKIINRIALSNVTSTFAIEQMKYTTALPL